MQLAIKKIVIFEIGIFKLNQQLIILQYTPITGGCLRCIHLGCVNCGGHLTTHDNDARGGVMACKIGPSGSAWTRKDGDLDVSHQS